jgi:hypothetical protein
MQRKKAETKKHMKSGNQEESDGADLQRKRALRSRKKRTETTREDHLCLLSPSYFRTLVVLSCNLC